MNINVDKLNLIVIAALTLLLSHIATDVFWLIFKPEAVQVTVTPKVLQKNLTLDAHIFGSKKIVKVAPPKTKVKKTKLNLDLIGILFKDNRSLAIIAPSGVRALAKIYAVGDSVKTGVKVKKIGVDFVILERGKTWEKLLFAKKEGEKNNIFGTKSLTKKSKLSTAQKKKLDDYRLEIISNPEKLLSIVNVVPFFKNGKMLGVKVKPNQDKKIFNDLGFKPNDIVTKVNNTKINSFDIFAKIRDIIYSNNFFDLEVERDNKTVYLSIQL